ncbi:MAG: hypothetical protein EYC70_00575 [Planctomycetota bacterium]|nr:MAG: hypothetical protein EYC70_00575 [Planctomycetota bacterium]
MALPESGVLQLGQTVLRWRGDGAPGRGDRVVELAQALPRLESWIAAGGLLGVQAVHPLASLARHRRSGYSLLALGPGAALPALAGVAYGFHSVAAVLPPEDRGAFLAAAESMRSGNEVLVAETLEQLRPGLQFQRVLLGCGGRVPALAEAAPLVPRLRLEGHWVWYGLPAHAVEDAFRSLAQRGMHLRGCGFSGGYAYLSGSLENPDSFRP